MRRCPDGRWIATGLLVLGLVAAPSSVAEDIEKKFRLSVMIGGWNAEDEVSSDAGNVLTLVDENLLLADRFIDPRDDSSVFGNLDVNSGQIATISGQYALTKVFLVEASVGYHRSNIGDVEAQVQYAGLDVPDLDNFRFATHRIPVGKMERVPIHLSAIARFRPRAKFNPYFGLGIGYAIIGFEPSDEFNELSINMDASRGGQATLTGARFGNPELVPPTSAQIEDLAGLGTYPLTTTFAVQPITLLNDNGVSTLPGNADAIIDFLAEILFGGNLTLAERQAAINYLNEDDTGTATPYDDDRIREVVGLLLGYPQFQEQ